MDQMRAMEAFVEAIRLRGLGAAAQSLGMSRTLVSRSIQWLEEDLGVRLMNRTTRSLSLTDAGRDYFHFCDDILTRVREMKDGISADANQARGEISVLAPKWMQTPATRMLVEFSKAHPEIRPRLTLGGMAQTAYGFLEQGCEIALHTRQIPDSRILARKIATIPYCLCASAEYLAAAPVLDDPADLASHRTLLQYNYHTWQFERMGRDERIQPLATLSANTFTALRDAALEGLGLTLLPEPLVREDLALGRLQQCLPEWEPQGQTLYTAVAPGHGIPMKVRLLLDFATSWFARNGV